MVANSLCELIVKIQSLFVDDLMERFLYATRCCLLEKNSCTWRHLAVNRQSLLGRQQQLTLD